MAGASRVAMNACGTVNYLFSDQLGSTSLTVKASDNNIVGDLRYAPWGESRYITGTMAMSYTYTGQYSHVGDFGLMFYVTRRYDPALGRFAQADSIVPDGVQGYDRYAYVNNSPISYNDPTGHYVCEGIEYCTPSGSGAGQNGGTRTGATSAVQKHWVDSSNLSVGFHLGATPSINSPDYSSDNPNEAVQCGKNVLCAIVGILSIVSRVPVANSNPSNADNLWVNVHVEMDESTGTTISNLTLLTTSRIL